MLGSILNGAGTMVLCSFAFLLTPLLSDLGGNGGGGGIVCADPTGVI